MVKPPAHPQPAPTLPAQVQLPVIGRLCSPLKQKFGVPRQPRLVPVPATVELFAPYDDPRAFDGLSGFSHVWLLWLFHHNRDADFRPLIRPPRLGGNARIGVFASRSMYRPAPLGLSAVELVGITVVDGRTRVQVRGADLVDGTPIVDIKPYLRFSDSIPEATSGFAEHAPVPMPVQWSTAAVQDTVALMQQGLLHPEQVSLIEQLLAQDPRPAYQGVQKNQADAQREYGMAYDRVNVRFVVGPEGLTVVAMQPVTGLPGDPADESGPKIFPTD